jgi:hypothetical protein
MFKTKIVIGMHWLFFAAVLQLQMLHHRSAKATGK